MKLVEEQAAFLRDVARLIDFVNDRGIVATGGELMRTQAQQAMYVSAGKSQTMASNHIRKLAIDLNFIKDDRLETDMGVLRPIGEFWESLHPSNRWGGNFKTLVDTPHFERNV